MNNGCNMFTKEPIIHSHITDVLPEEHPMANQEVYCKSCGVMLHSSTNECMQTWYETEFGNYCTKCFSPIAVMELLEECFLTYKSTPVEKEYVYDGLCAFCREEGKGCGCCGEIKPKTKGEEGMKYIGVEELKQWIEKYIFICTGCDETYSQKTKKDLLAFIDENCEEEPISEFQEVKQAIEKTYEFLKKKIEEK